MIKGKHGVASLCLLVGCLSAQPVMALSPKALQQSGSRRFLTPSPHTTLRAASHRAVHQPLG
ncbi:hypothetical protein [Thiothrix subterranea]|uniref:hypothetical protein n=1 Tax=Thiothrix subterranea TaxID=2735563 RepID=UPI00280B7D5E|nr:hypothetical protein [Thiothrix subterranea]